MEEEHIDGSLLIEAKIDAIAKEIDEKGGI